MTTEFWILMGFCALLVASGGIAALAMALKPKKKPEEELQKRLF